jgi:DNA polymerase-3 subunit alpha
MQYDILGYVETKDPTLDKRYIIVTQLDTTWSPKFQAYCIATGQTVEMKVHKTRDVRKKLPKISFREAPFEDGDVLYMTLPQKKENVKKVDGEWVNTGTQSWWLEDYRKVDL